MSSFQPGSREYWTLIRAGYSREEALELLHQFELRTPTEERRDTTIHKIGKVHVTYHVRWKVKFYEVTIDGKFVAQDRDLSWALKQARTHMPPKPQKKITGELIAYRAWLLIGDILMPVSRAHDYDTWDGPVAKSDENPTDSEVAGLWAIKLNNKDAIRDLLKQYLPDVHGMIALSGTVVEHEIGYRAERATIRVLRVVPPVSDGLLKLLADRYQCQVFRAKHG